MKRLLFLKTTALVFLVMFAMSATGYAVDPTPPAPAAASQSTCGANDASSKGQVLQGANIDNAGNDCSGNSVNSAVKAAVNILSLIVGIVAVIMVVLSGFKYVTSGGDSNKVASAKSTLIYALVGLAITALAQTLVHFVLFHVKP